MNKLLYAAALLFCFAGCKKTEDNDRVKFVRVTISDKSTYGNMAIRYDGKDYFMGSEIAVAVGDKKFEIFNRKTGKIVLDTTLNIPAPDVFYLYQTDTLIRPVLVRSPLSGEADAPLGYMKLRIANKAQIALPYEKMDLIVTSFYQSNGAYVMLDTLHNITADFNKELFLVKRQQVGEVLQQSYRFIFINSLTGESVKSTNGAVYMGVFSVGFNKGNLYMLELTQVITRTTATAIPMNGKYYSITTNITWQR